MKRANLIAYSAAVAIIAAVLSMSIPGSAFGNDLAERSGRGGVEGANTEWPLIDTSGEYALSAKSSLDREAGENPALVLKFLELPRAGTVAQTPVLIRQSQINSTTQGRHHPYSKTSADIAGPSTLIIEGHNTAYNRRSS